MQDDPNPAEILDVTADFLRTTVIPQLPAHTAFLVRVSANALDLVRRQIRLAHYSDEEERWRLEELTGLQGTLTEMNAALCDLIREHRIDERDESLLQHLWATTLAKLAVDQPGYAAYLRAISASRDADPETEQE